MGANKYRGQVELRIEEEDECVTVYRLHYDANAIVEIEDAMDCPINHLITQKLHWLDGFKFQRAALKAGLQRDPRGRKLSLQQCGEMLSTTKEQRQYIARTILKGVFLALGADIDEAAEAAKAEEEAAAADDKKPAKKKGKGESPLALAGA